MNVENLESNLVNRIYKTAESIIESRARTLTALLKYEIAVANTELAMLSKEHGYDFKFIPEDYANAAMLSPIVRDGGHVSITLTIPPHALKDASESMVEYFKTYIMANAITKLRNGA